MMANFGRQARSLRHSLLQRANANINCRIFPGVPVESVRQKLVELVN
jgi:hypothetical protein